MGGYGALKWALHQPERFAAVASLSGAVDVRTLLPERPRSIGACSTSGSDPTTSWRTCSSGVAPMALPPMFVGCGTEDALFEDNVRFADQASAAGVDVRTDFRPGEHEWALWDATIAAVLAWLPLRR